MDWAHNPQICRIAQKLHEGAVIAYPTEAVWGLGCDPANRTAVERILELKGRPMSKGLILVAASIEQFAPYLSLLTEAQRQALETSWPGPVTWLVPDGGRAPAWVRGHHPAVALRVSAHPVVAGLCRAFGGPLVSTSANRAGMREARDSTTVRRQFGSALEAIAPGRIGKSERPSEIRDLLTGVVLRKG
ncbi:tRNA threonylcarbamoyladenosine biosynthesis protein RimN [Proteobacteria bacterium 005FR1]|nr:tRNA threonylcarbamoyladenosine biosynthesis protein RimN [Proteobacteria bacterium 005FR1]